MFTNIQLMFCCKNLLNKYHFLVSGSGSQIPGSRGWEGGREEGDVWGGGEWEGEREGMYI